MRLAATNNPILLANMLIFIACAVYGEQPIKQDKEVEFWSYSKPAKIKVPGKFNWGYNEIDSFIFEKIKDAGLSPEEEASKEEWLRRVSFDVTGLPPSIEDIDNFLNDESKFAYRRVIKKLLSSKSYGERMAVWWLDGARYGDSHGYDNDLENSQWPW